VSKRLDGVEPGGLDRGEHAEDDADCGTEGEAHDDRPERDVRFVEPRVGDEGEPEGEPLADEHPDRAADQTQHHRLEQELQQHRGGGRPDRLPQTDLGVRSLTDTSMMFMMPMPPTSRLTPTMPPAIAVMPAASALNCEMN